MRPLAVFFVYVWPEPRSSAAGVRTMELCRNLRELGYEVRVLSPSRENAASAELNSEGFSTFPCQANDSSLERELLALQPSLVVYDRFVMEEQFGWRAREIWPDALHLVDTQDLHTVRRARERLMRSGAGPEEVLSLSGAELSPDLERELASLHRADACFVVSSWEKEWLVAQGYPEERALWLPFGAAPEPRPASFGQRRGFAFLGNFRHPPNLDAVRWLAEEIWPGIRARLPSEKLYLYGAYPPAFVSALGGKNGIEAMGPVESHREALLQHRVLLAPLRFGAGIKGKVLEAWATGTPVAGTPIALEGLGLYGTATAGELVEAAVELHEKEETWRRAQEAGFQALSPFDPQRLYRALASFLAVAQADRPRWRRQLVGRMLRHQRHNATKYFSLWIEQKEKNKGG